MLYNVYIEVLQPISVFSFLGRYKFVMRKSLGSALMVGTFSCVGVVSPNFSPSVVGNASSDTMMGMFIVMALCAPLGGSVLWPIAVAGGLYEASNCWLEYMKSRSEQNKKVTDAKSFDYNQMISIFYEKLLDNAQDCILKNIEELSFPENGKYPRELKIALDAGFIFSAMDNTKFLFLEKFIRTMKQPSELVPNNSRVMEVRNRDEVPQYLRYTIEPLTDLTDEGIHKFVKFLSRNLSTEGKERIVSQFFGYNMDKFRYRMSENKTKTAVVVRSR